MMTMKRMRSEVEEEEETTHVCPPTGGRFECKTCKRRFGSFQALGGHRASHKKTRPDNHNHEPKVAKRHECSLCGVVFSMGQALGGHMRRHRATMEESPAFVLAPPPELVVLRRSNSNVRVSAPTWWLDLNLTPLENDLKLLFAKMAPRVDPFIS